MTEDPDTQVTRDKYGLVSITIDLPTMFLYMEVGTRSYSGYCKPDGDEGTAKPIMFEGDVGEFTP